ncbi:methyltransferase, putative [Plasmodium sp. gorilla clade G2]|uniref:methyltransferase, putative n=1 Tax=Plasmodium sp. gorilla clade G2 TaxID=880535 RepID=UPI000D2284F6|nr:methyltransferase, putative [Plasmodium sp. gorilla clade G2]SOV12813.1 methyltransferase, putative [Plasmodium sp. gorilla clade G2]
MNVENLKGKDVIMFDEKEKDVMNNMKDHDNKNLYNEDIILNEKKDKSHDNNDYDEKYVGLKEGKENFVSFKDNKNNVINVKGSTFKNSVTFVDKKNNFKKNVMIKGDYAHKKDDEIYLDKNNLFNEINLLIKKKLKINDVIKLDLFHKDNSIQIKPYVIFDDYKNVNIENKISIEIINFLKNCIENNKKYINIHSSVVELRGTFNDELINLPILNETILQKISNNNYKYKFNIDNEVLNYIYVDLFNIHKSKYKFKILEKIFEIEELYYYDVKQEKERKKNINIKKSEDYKNDEQTKEFINSSINENNNENSKNDDSSSSVCADSDVLINLYKEVKKEEDKERKQNNHDDDDDNMNEDLHEKIKKNKKKKKKKIDKDKLYIEKLKKLVEEGSADESYNSSNDKSSEDYDDGGNDKNQILYKRKIIYSKWKAPVQIKKKENKKILKKKNKNESDNKENDKSDHEHNNNNNNNLTVIKIFKEVENDIVCVYYPNSSYNQCLCLSSYEYMTNGHEHILPNNHDIYGHNNNDDTHMNNENFCIDTLNEENIRIKKRYVKDISIYNFCCDEKYKGCNLYLHISKTKKLKNCKLNYNIPYEHFLENYDIIKMYEIKKDKGNDNKNNDHKNNDNKINDDEKINCEEQINSDHQINCDQQINCDNQINKGEKKRNPIGKLFEIEKDWKINIDMHIDIEKLIKEYKKCNNINEEIQMSDNNPMDDKNIQKCKSNKLHYMIYNFYKNFDCLMNLINRLKNNSIKYEYYFPKMIGDVNEEIRKHYDKKKVILLKKSNIKYIRVFNNEVKRIMILFFVSYNSKILDLACGHGQDMLKYNTVQNKVYVGIDLSKKEIELAKERLNQNDMKGLCNSDNFIFLQGDILNNKFYRKWKSKNIMFDIISINLALHYVIYNEKSSKKFFKIIENFLENDGLLLATTISTVTLTDFLMKRSNIEMNGDNITITLENDLFTIKFDQENLLKIFKNKICLEEFIEFINNNSGSQIKYDYFSNLIKYSLDNVVGIKYYFYLYDTIDAHEFVIPQTYLKKKLEELDMVELFNNTAIMFLHYITNNLETYEKYENIKYFHLLNKTIDHNIFKNIKERINKIHGYSKDSQIYYDICSLYHVYVYKKNFDATILGTM